MIPTYGVFFEELWVNEQTYYVMNDTRMLRGIDNIGTNDSIQNDEVEKPHRPLGNLM